MLLRVGCFIELTKLYKEKLVEYNYVIIITHKTMRNIIVAFSSTFLACALQLSCTSSVENTIKIQLTKQIKPAGKTIAERFEVPEGYYPTSLASNSFGEYLRNLPLKPIDASVHLFDGRIKANHQVYCSVVDQEIDPVDLQQCADAVMRLRGEYLFAQKKMDAIKFNFLSDGKPRYFKDYAKGDYSYKKFRAYMKYIFSYANTASLKKELTPVNDIQNIEVGDVFIQSGNPFGHAVIVVNLIENKQGEKKMMLAQSYMPAQETQILVNRNDNNSPWFAVKTGNLLTPEWEFHSSDLRRF